MEEITSFHAALKKFEKSFGFKNEINWRTATIISTMHIVGVYWFWNYAFPAKVATVVWALSYGLVGNAGITCGVHRYFTHKSYKVNQPLKIFLALAFYSVGQNSIYQWVRDHRVHHKCSDTEADPHNANRGFFFSHIGWLMMKKNEKVKAEGKKIDMSDIENDKFLMFLEKYSFYVTMTFAYFIPTAVNIFLLGEDWKCAIAWQCFWKHLFVLHCEMTVNSLAHIYGYQPYNKNIVPKENTFVSLFTNGEGWHNYHHVFPFDYKAAEFFDLNKSASLIRWWAKMGWAYDLKEATPDMIKSVINRLGDDSQKIVKEK